MGVNDLSGFPGMPPWLAELAGRSYPGYQNMDPEFLQQLIAQRGANPNLPGSPPNPANANPLSGPNFGPMGQSLPPASMPNLSGYGQNAPGNPGDDITAAQRAALMNVGPPPQPQYSPLWGGSANTGLPAPSPPGYAGSTGASVDPRGYDAAINRMTGMAPGTVNPAYQPPGIVPGRNAPSVAGSPAQGAAPGAAAVPGAMANNNRWVQEYRPNADPLNPRGGPPMMTALNLAGLFGRGQPAVNPNAPAPNAQNVSGPLAKGANWSSAPWGMGPFQRGSMGPRVPPQGLPMPSDRARARILNPNYYGT
jgi:hypothetical protein